MQVYGYQGLKSGEQSEQLLAGFIRRAGSSHGKQGSPLVIGTKYFTGDPEHKCQSTQVEAYAVPHSSGKD